MQITKITARRVVQKSIGQYEYDQRTFEYEAALEAGENPAPATAYLYELLDNSIRLAGGVPEPVREVSPVSAPTLPATPVEPTPAPVTEPAPAQEPAEVLSAEELAAKVAVLARTVGAPKVISTIRAFGVGKVTEVPAERRQEFLAALQS